MFMFTKSERYYYDPKAVLEINGRNLRTVWNVHTLGFAGAHFATFPPKLIEPCIKAATRPGDFVLESGLGIGNRRVGLRRAGAALRWNRAESGVRHPRGRSSGNPRIDHIQGRSLMFNIPDPDLQINFATLLNEIRRLYLQDALNDTVRRLSVPQIDQELAIHAPAHSLSLLAGHGGLRRWKSHVPGASPFSSRTRRLLGYYRLLYGYSQKEFIRHRQAWGHSRRWKSAALSQLGIRAHLPIFVPHCARQVLYWLPALGRQGSASIFSTD